MLEYQGGEEDPATEASEADAGDNEWIQAFKGGKPSAGNFLNAAACSEAICLAGVAIRSAERTSTKAIPHRRWSGTLKT